MEKTKEELEFPYCRCGNLHLWDSYNSVWEVCKLDGKTCGAIEWDEGNHVYHIVKPEHCKEHQKIGE